MKLSATTLVIETASEACSVALIGAGGLIAADHQEIGRGHAENLVPMIAALPAKGRAEQILVSLGPGSFTGVRIGIAAARALGLAWRAPVSGFPTLALVAATARASRPEEARGHPLTVCMNAGHGEWFVQDFNANGAPCSAMEALSPVQASTRQAMPLIVGNRAQALAEVVQEPVAAINLLPNAQATDKLADDLTVSDLRPIYGRAPDAKPSAVQHSQAIAAEAGAPSP